MRTARVRTVFLLSATVFAAVTCSDAGGNPVQLPPFTVTPDGGTLAFLDSAIVVTIPAGAVTDTTEFTIAASSATAPTLIAGTAFTLTTNPVIANFNAPITIKLDLPGGALPTGILAAELGGYSFNSANSTWSKIAGSSLDAGFTQLTVPLTSPGTFALLGAPAVSVVLTPAVDTVVVANNVSFTAVVKDAAANTLPQRVVTWTSTATGTATVNGSGSVTGVAAGTASIIASVASENIADTSTIVVQAAGPPPIDNEPAGYTLLSDRDWAALATCGQSGTRLNLWDDVEACSGNLSVISDASAPKSPPSVLEWRYPAGFAGGSAPGTAQRPVSASNFTKLYVSVYVQLSANWQGQSSQTNKMFFIWANGEARFFLSAEGSGSSALQPQLRLQGTLPDARPRLQPNIVPGAVITRGVWQHWEVIVECTTPGTANGRARWFIDGVLISDYSNINWAQANESCKWEQVQLRPVWGGTGDNVVNAMYLRMDHIRISGAP